MAPVHAASPGYAIDRFVADPGFISDVVRFDLPRLGDVRGLDGVHLQCHIGTDTVSLARLGARMTGLDFSPPAIREARTLAGRLGLDVSFVESDVDDAAGVLGRARFDLVFTGVGALCWLPDIRGWARVCGELLRPGGRLFVREGHPVLWALEEPRPDRLLVLGFPYFEQQAAMVWDAPGTYVETEHVFEHTVTHEWNHGLGEIVTALLDAGFQLTMLVEHDSVPWEAIPGQMVLAAGGEWQLAEHRERLPLTYTLTARRV